MFVDKVLKKIPREIYIYILWGIVVGAVNEKLKAEKGIKSDEVTDATEY